VKHVPLVTISHGKATVLVPHPMTDDHFIEYIWAKNQDSVIIAAVKLRSNNTAELEFDVPRGTISITGFEACNK
jgi:desulfoferrodoxin (superoxide reductase-like protein)